MQNIGTPLMLGSSLLCVLSSFALAQSTGQPACRTIPDKEQRLACYDKLFEDRPAEQQPPPSGSTPMRASTAAQAPPQPSSTTAASSEFGGEIRHPKASPKRLEAVVTDVAPIGQGLYRLTLDNGQVWDTTQADWALEFRASNRVTISRMMLGNYLIARAGEGRTVAVKRVK